MKTHILKFMRGWLLIAAMTIGAAGLMAQNSLPAPGSGGSFSPAGGGPGGPGFGGGGGPAWNPGPPAPAVWGSPWYTGWNTSPTIVISPSVTTNTNTGTEKVIACGYDATGVWRVLPMLVSYSYNGLQYDVNVINAWNPWTDEWDTGIDQQAYNTDYTLRNVNYDFYVVLSYGTFYFNL